MAPRSVVISGDTVPCAGLDDLCAGADVLVHTVVRRDLIEQIGIPRLNDVLGYHSSVPDAAKTASRGGVRTLVLATWCQPLHQAPSTEWVAQAAEHFAGEIIMATDLLSICTRCCRAPAALSYRRLLIRRMRGRV